MSRVIAAISTPIAMAGLGIIRMSGEEAIEVADRMFRPCSKEKSIQTSVGYTALYGHVFDSEGDIDECVALIFRVPHSYTGENVVELSCHGGIYVLQRTLRAAFNAGASPAEAGEFTKRAFINGKLDLTQAEAVMQLISANGRIAAKTALAAREGVTFRKIEEIKGQLLGAAANLTAFVDYPDEDIPDLSEEKLNEILQNTEEKLKALLSTFDAGRILREGIDTVIVGRPNVGKSSLMNLLAGCERSIVTPIEGTTRDIVEESIRLGDVVLRLADTAGLHETTNEIESIGVKRARDRMKSAALVLAMFDGSQPLTEDDRRLAETADDRNTIAIINKSDLGLMINEQYIRSLFSRVVIISANVGEGLDELRQAVYEVTGVGTLDSSEPILATERQRNCIRHCLDCVREAQDALRVGITLDAIGVSIDSAITSLLELTGERATEAIVNEVFSRFCVGK